MENEEVNQLLKKYLKGECTPLERQLVEAWLNKRLVTDKWQWKDEADKTATKARIRQKIEKAIIRPKVPSININRILTWAASVAVIIGILLFINIRGTKQQIAVNKPVIEAVKPGTQTAILTLDDGEVIRLDGANQGVLAQRKHVTIKKLNGQLVYEAKGLQATESPFMNKINIPRGGQYKVTLPDGTDVWLNSASSLSYPSSFTGKERQVELTGEAYFEVAKNKKMPFKVKAGDINIKVTGTHFNVSAYDNDDRILTTLLEGSVEVVRNAKKIKLHPGQQAISISDSDYFISHTVDAEAAIAWKNGYFVFEDQDIESVMRDVSRWYNVEVTIIRKTEKGKKVGGTFSRSKSLEDLLLYLGKLEVAKFKKEGRRITVMI